MSSNRNDDREAFHVRVLQAARRAAVARHPHGRHLQERARHRHAAGQHHPGRRRQAGPEPLRQQLPRPGPASRRDRRRPARRSTAGATAWPACASSAARRSVHKQLEAKLSEFLGTEDTILYSSCFDANGGLFETLLGERGRDHLRRAEPRQHHRRRPALQGAALPLREQRHGRPGGASCRRPPAPASA